MTESRRRVQSGEPTKEEQVLTAHLVRRMAEIKRRDPRAYSNPISLDVLEAIGERARAAA